MPAGSLQDAEQGHAGGPGDGMVRWSGGHGGVILPRTPAASTR